MSDPQEKPRSPAVVLRLPRDHYERLSEEAQRLTESEGRKVTVTEVVRRRIVDVGVPSAA